MRIIKIAMNDGYGGWLSPDGEFFPVERYGHGYNARKILRKIAPELLNDDGKWDEDYKYDLYEDEVGTNELMDRNYVHVMFDPLELDFRGSASSQVKRKLFQFINNDESGLISIFTDNADIRRTNKLDARRFLHENCP